MCIFAHNFQELTDPLEIYSRVTNISQKLVCTLNIQMPRENLLFYALSNYFQNKKKFKSNNRTQFIL